MLDLFWYACLLLQVMKHGCMDPFNVPKALIFSGSLSGNVWVSLSIVLTYKSNQSRVEKNTFYLVKHVNMRLMDDICFTQHQLWNRKGCWNKILEYVCTYKIQKFPCIEGFPFFYKGLPNYFYSCYSTQAFYACLLCFAPFATFISSHCLITQREQEAGSACFPGLAWASCSDKHCPVTLGRERWFCLGRPANAQTRVRVSACLCVCELFCPLNVSLPPSICLLTDGRLTVHSVIMGDKLQGLQRAHKALSSLTSSSSWDVF